VDPYQGEIFSIPSAGFLLCHPPDFPSILPFFVAIYHHQAFSPAPTVIVRLPAGTCPVIKACGQAVRIKPSPDIPLGYIRFSFQQGIREAFTPIPPTIMRPTEHTWSYWTILISWTDKQSPLMVFAV